MFHVAASEIPQGKSAAYIFSILVSDNGQDPTLVPPTKIPPLAPFGPSEVLIAGIPFSGMAFVLQKSAAVSKEI